MNWYTEQCIKTIKAINKKVYKLKEDDKVDQIHQQLLEAFRENNQAKFSSLLLILEQYEQKKVEEEIKRLRQIVSTWSIDKKQELGELINQLEEKGIDHQKAIQMAYYQMAEKAD
jgi:hypothetical protein